MARRGMLPVHPESPPGWSLVRCGAEAELRLTGDWIVRETGLRDAVAVLQVMTQAEGTARLRFDVRGLGRWDSALVAFVWALRSASRAELGASAPVVLDETGLPEPARRLLALAAETAPALAAPPSSEPPLVRLGRRGIAAWNEVVATAALVGETALRGGAALRGGVRTRAVDTLQQMHEAGIRALVIVAVVNGLVGGILAFVGAVQLRRFGASIFVADLVGIATVREMAAVMTGIVMAGRTGGAYAAHIATMQGNEEIDALKALGIPIYDHLVLPRVAALVAMMPLLYLYACAVGLLGGLAVGVMVLDITPAAYLQETRRAISGTQFLIGLAKSVAFGALVALAGCRVGLKAGRSAVDVGQAATGATVTGIIGVIALDGVFAVCTDALGI